MTDTRVDDRADVTAKHPSPEEPEPERRVDGAGTRMRVTLGALWSNPRIAVTIGVGIVAAWALVAGWWTPRGPLTTSEALWSMAISTLVGTVAGLMLRSRWAMLSTPLTFVAVFELVRVDEQPDEFVDSMVDTVLADADSATQEAAP